MSNQRHTDSSSTSPISQTYPTHAENCQNQLIYQEKPKNTDDKLTLQKSVTFNEYWNRSGSVRLFEPQIAKIDEPKLKVKSTESEPPMLISRHKSPLTECQHFEEEAPPPRMIQSPKRKLTQAVPVKILVGFLLAKIFLLLFFLIQAACTLFFYLDESAAKHVSDVLKDQLASLKRWTAFFWGFTVVNLGFTFYTLFSLLRKRMSPWHMIIEFLFFAYFTFSLVFFGLGEIHPTKWLFQVGYKEVLNHPEMMIKLKCCGFRGPDDFQRTNSWKHCPYRADGYGIYDSSSVWPCTEPSLLPIQCCNVSASGNVSAATRISPCFKSNAVFKQGCKEPLNFWLDSPVLRILVEITVWLFFFALNVQFVFVCTMHLRSQSI